MATGTLVPFMNLIALPGDTFDIRLNADVKTLPTLAPLFGSFKLQLDVYSCPLRLYNRQLHNNKLGIGLEMNKVKFPTLKLKARNPRHASNLNTTEPIENSVVPSLYINLGFTTLVLVKSDTTKSAVP